MKIIYVENENINRISSGGIMSYLINLSKSFINKGYETVLVGSGFKESKSEYFSFAHSMNDNYIKNNLSFFTKLFNNSFNHLVSKGDIFHVQRLEMCLPIFFRFSNKIICTIHGSQIKSVNIKKDFFSRIFFKIAQYISLIIIDKIIFVDRDNYNFYKKKFPWIKDKINLIPISIDTNLFYNKNDKSNRLKYNLSNRFKIALYVGRLEVEKNINFIINCFKEIKDEDYKLIIVGSGSQMQNLMIEASNDYRVIFLGEVDHTEIPNIINMADVLVLCSIFEGSPNIIKEALCCNVPVISTDVGDVKEVVNKINGGFILPLVKSKWINELTNVLSFKSNFGDQSRQIFGLKNMISKTEKVYTSVK